MSKQLNDKCLKEIILAKTGCALDQSAILHKTSLQDQTKVKSRRLKTFNCLIVSLDIKSILAYHKIKSKKFI